MDYTAWLIEMSEQFGPLYFHFGHDDDWTKDHDKACHFSRKEDAEKVIAHYGWTRVQAVEHCWPEPTIHEVVAESNGHHWIKAFNMLCCRDCGIVRRADDKNKTCKGVVKIGPRVEPSQPAGNAAREALEECIETLSLVEHVRSVDPAYGEEVRELGERIGYGALMSSASASWRKSLAARGYPLGAEFVAGPCYATVVGALKKARAALQAREAESGIPKSARTKKG